MGGIPPGWEHPAALGAEAEGPGQKEEVGPRGVHARGGGPGRVHSPAAAPSPPRCPPLPPAPQPRPQTSLPIGAGKEERGSGPAWRRASVAK